MIDKINLDLNASAPIHRSSIRYNGEATKFVHVVHKYKLGYYCDSCAGDLKWYGIAATSRDWRRLPLGNSYPNLLYNITKFAEEIKKHKVAQSSQSLERVGQFATTESQSTGRVTSGYESVNLK